MQQRHAQQAEMQQQKKQAQEIKLPRGVRGTSPAGSDKSNDTARLSFSMNKSEEGQGEEEVTITGTGTNENDNDIESVLTSPSQQVKAQMPAVKSIKTKTISQVCQQDPKQRPAQASGASGLPQSQGTNR